jgi:hypothetical protein
MLRLVLVMPVAAEYLTEQERTRLREIFAAAQRRAAFDRSDTA